jgi:hypothetical protein
LAQKQRIEAPGGRHTIRFVERLRCAGEHRQVHHLASMLLGCRLAAGGLDHLSHSPPFGVHALKYIQQCVLMFLLIS